jgi:hypothetical protein
MFILLGLGSSGSEFSIIEFYKDVLISHFEVGSHPGSGISILPIDISPESSSYISFFLVGFISLVMI